MPRRRRLFRYRPPKINTRGPLDDAEYRYKYGHGRPRRRRAKPGCPMTVLALALAATLVYVVARIFPA